MTPKTPPGYAPVVYDMDVIEYIFYINNLILCINLILYVEIKLKRGVERIFFIEFDGRAI